MKTDPVGHDFWISRSYKASDWQNLSFKSEGDWQTAIAIVTERISERFVRWIDTLIGESHSGFATVALDCLLLETLHGFQQGATTFSTVKVYEVYLTRPALGFDQDSAKKFQKEVRNKLLHNGQTHGRWLIRKEKPDDKIFEKDASGNFILNRSQFHRAIKADFENWLSMLDKGDQTLRAKMRKRMEQVIEQHSVAEV